MRISSLIRRTASSRGGSCRRGDPERRRSFGLGLLRFARHDVTAFVITLLLALPVGPAFAVDPQEQLKDPKLEARAREISAGLRCLVCQNQSIDDSDAPLAKDLRLIVRQQLQKGASDRQAVDYVVARYGEFVLLNPRLRLNTLILWLTPLFLLAGGLPSPRASSAASRKRPRPRRPSRPKSKKSCSRC